jgi:TRAP-type C4-dicarboxylate transport system permease small subunit
MPDPVSLASDGELLHVPGSVDPGTRALPRGPVMDRIRAGLNGLDSGFRAILVFALVIQLVIVLTGIVSRFWFHQSLLWADEAAKLFLSLTAFVGGALAFRARHHTTVEFLTGRFSPRWRASFAIGIDLLILVAVTSVGYVSLDLLSISATSNTPILDINAAWLILPLTVGLVLVALFVIERLVYDCAPRAVILPACVVALLVGTVYAISIVPSLHFGNGAALGVMLVAFLLAVLLGFPSALRCCWAR